MLAFLSYNVSGQINADLLFIAAVEHSKGKEYFGIHFNRSYWELHRNLWLATRPFYSIKDSGNSSYKIKVEKNLRISKANELRFAAGWAHEEQ
ncbi:MAG: hypothetical protein R6U11_01370 [Bacteroidales bacterium]